MDNVAVKKRGPKKKPGYRQELRVTPTVEKVFEQLKVKYNLKNNSEALNKIAEIFSTKSDSAASF